MRKRIAALLAALLLAAAALPACRGYERQSISYYDLFDTYCSFTVYGISGKDFDGLAEDLHTLLRRFHELTDIYHEYDEPNAAAINRLAGQEAVSVDPLLADFLRWALGAGEKTGGLVNICLGAVTSLWHEARENALADPSSAELPSEEALREASAHTAPSVLRIEGNEIYLCDPAARLDLGALAKGYAARLAAEFLAGRGVTNYLLSLGGSIVAKGEPLGSGRNAFRIGIQDPSGEEGSYCEVLELRDRAVATSGDYQRYFELDGVRYHHLIDPATLRPSAQSFRSVTVVCEDPAEADLLSTALFLLNETEGRRLAEAFGAAVYYH